MGYKVETEYEDGTKSIYSAGFACLKFVFGHLGEKLLGMTELQPKRDGFPVLVKSITITKY